MNIAQPDGPGGCAAQAVSIEVLSAAPLYSENLGIDLGSGRDPEFFKWFLASLLFGGHISETIAARTYHTLGQHRLLSPKRILDAGWSYLVDPVMREGGYVRYDGRKSTQLLRDCETLLAEYGGSLQRLHAAASDAADLEDRLLDFFGVGPVTANIFLRELRPFWEKADPDPLPIVYELASQFEFDLDAIGRKTLVFARIEAGLIRHSHQRRALRRDFHHANIRN